MSNFFQGFSFYQGRIQSLNELVYVYPHPPPPEGKTFFLCRGEGPATCTFTHSSLLTSTLGSTRLLHPIVFLFEAQTTGVSIQI